MATTRKGGALFPALLKHWRRERSLSQLDLALAADVSSRHVSFMETGRAKPSREMVLRLGAVLSVPLRDQNTLLLAADFEPEFETPSFEDGLSPVIEGVIHRMLEAHEPYPMVIMNHRYDSLRINNGATRLMMSMIADPSAIPDPLNAFHLLFDPKLSRSFIVDWERTARQLLVRLHRECLLNPGDEGLSELHQSLFDYPDVPADWREPDLTAPMDPTFMFRLRRGDVELAMITTLTVFSAPQNVTLEELRIESYFPADDATKAFLMSCSPPKA